MKLSESFEAFFSIRDGQEGPQRRPARRWLMSSKGRSSTLAGKGL
ncbi:hypothetical protein [Trinickia sp. EG282A]